MLPIDLGFPSQLFPTWRKYQREAARCIYDALTPHGIEPDDRTVVLEAPTGAGKSVTAVAVAKLLAKDLGAPPALILVATKVLADQYENSLPDMVAVIKGRSNYPCRIWPKLNAGIAPCDTQKGRKGRKRTVCKYKSTSKCPYYAAKQTALMAPIAVTNYQYALNELNYVGKFQRPFLILDEAHRVEAQLMMWVAIGISRKTLAECEIPGVVKVGSRRSFTGWQNWAERVSPMMVRAELKARSAAEDHNWERGLTRQWRRIERTRDAVNRLAKLIQPWLMDHNVRRVRFRPIWVADHAQRWLFGHGQMILLMSATPPYLPALGLEEETTARLIVPSTFPVKNRPFVYEPLVDLSYKNRGADVPRLIEQCDKVFAEHPNQKGIVHTVSYKLRDVFMERSRSRNRMLTHDLANRAEVLEQFKASASPQILVSPSMGEGISLDDDLARFQIVAKVPWLSLGDRQVRARLKEDSTWYRFAAATAVVQAYGRIVRSATDWGTTYCFDQSLARLLAQEEEMFPGWFLEAVECNGEPWMDQ